MQRKNILSICNKIIEIALLAVIYSIPFSRAIVESAAATVIVVWIFKRIFVEKGNLYVNTSFNWPIFIYTAICFISVIFSTNIYLSLRTFICKTIEYLLLFFIVIDTIKDERRIKRIGYIFLVITGLVVIDGLFQYFIGWDFFRRRTMIIPKRISGPFVYPGDFGAYLVTIIPVFLGFNFIASSWLKKRAKILLFLVLLLLLICLILNVTKSAWLSFVISVSAGVFLIGKKRMFLVPIIMCIAIIIFANPHSAIKSRAVSFFNFSEGGGKDRQLLWKTTAHMFIERPFFGQGLGTYMYNFNRFKSKEFAADYKISYPHNCFLQMAAEIGIFGLLAFIWMVCAILIKSIQILKNRKEDAFLHTVLWGLLLGLIAYLAQSFFDTSLYSLPLAILFWVVLGLIVAAINIIKKQSFS